jgi:tagatose 6-phosphate kinase
VIVTVTLNAALDVYYDAKQVNWDDSNQVSRVRYQAGGRGVAVARVLHTFGHEVIAAGLVGGSTGETIRADLARSGIPAEFTLIGRESRRVLEVQEAGSGRRLTFIEPGPYITTEELGRFATDYRRLLAGATAVVLCGSLPTGMPPEVYGTLATYAAEAGVPAILDAGGPALGYGAARHPALVIPDSGSVPSTLLTPATQPPARPADPHDLDPHDLDPRQLVAGGVGAVAVLSPHAIRAITPAGDWLATLPRTAGTPGTAGSSGSVGTAGTPGTPGTSGTPDTLGIPAGPGSAPWPRDALVAGLVPGVLLDWSWPDRLRHAVALGASATESGDVDLAAYERLVGLAEVRRQRRPQA